MAVSKEEILHIAKLANLNIKDEEIDKYAKNLEDILKIQIFHVLFHLSMMVVHLRLLS